MTGAHTHTNTKARPDRQHTPVTLACHVRAALFSGPTDKKRRVGLDVGGSKSTHRH